jgi:hypothetical protein
VTPPTYPLHATHHTPQTPHTTDNTHIHLQTSVLVCLCHQRHRARAYPTACCGALRRIISFPLTSLKWHRISLAVLLIAGTPFLLSQCHTARWRWVSGTGTALASTRRTATGRISMQRRSFTTECTSSRTVCRLQSGCIIQLLTCCRPRLWAWPVSNVWLCVAKPSLCLCHAVANSRQLLNSRHPLHVCRAADT